MGKLDGKVAIVTGGASGIGAATVRAMVREGAKVGIADVNGAGAKSLTEEIAAQGGDVLAIEVDVIDAEQVKAMVDVTVDRFGGLDILHNNAADVGDGYRKDLDLLTVDIEMWDRQMAVNLRGPMLGCKYAIPHMIERGGGSIVNTSSVASLSGELVMSAYSCSKGGLNVLTRVVATQYGRKGIRCNAVAPGMTLSPGAMANTTPAFREMYMRHFLTPYAGSPEMVADAVLFLASDESRFITAQVITADGGMLSHVPKYADLLSMDPETAGPNYAYLYAK